MDWGRGGVFIRENSPQMGLETPYTQYYMKRWVKDIHQLVFFRFLEILVMEESTCLSNNVFFILPEKF